MNGKVGTQVRADSVPDDAEQVPPLVAQAVADSPVFVRMADEWVNDLSKLTSPRRRHGRRRTTR